MKCTNCGSLIEEHYDYCANCGSNISEQKIRKLVINRKKWRITKIIMFLAVFIFTLLFSYTLLFNYDRTLSLQGIWNCGDFDSDKQYASLANIEHYFQFQFFKNGTFMQKSLDGYSTISGSYTETESSIPDDYDSSVVSVKKVNTFSSLIEDSKEYFEKAKSNTYEFDIFSGDTYALVSNLNTGKMYVCLKK